MTNDKCQELSLTICTGELKLDERFLSWLLAEQLIGYAVCLLPGIHSALA